MSILVAGALLAMGYDLWLVVLFAVVGGLVELVGVE